MILILKMKQFFFFLIEKSEPQMGLEPTTLRDLVGCSNHWATGDSMVSEGQFVGLDWNRIARLHSQVLVSTCENSLTASRCHIKAYQDAANQPPKWAYKDETIFFNRKIRAPDGTWTHDPHDPRPTIQMLYDNI